MKRAATIRKHLPDILDASVQYYPADETTETAGDAATIVNYPVRVRNGRGLGHTIDEHAFALATLPYEGLAGVDLYDPKAMSAHMYPLAEAVLRETFPDATKVFVFDHILRNGARAKAEVAAHGKVVTPLLAAGPALLVHGDYTVRSGFTRATQLLSPHDDAARVAAVVEGTRFAFVNVWVPLAPVEKDPLGLIEWGSQKPADVHTVRFIYKHRLGEIYHVRPSADHRWVYYPRMTPGECLVFKVFDSDTSPATARFSLHGAFTDPTAPPSATERESVELRCMVLLGDVPAGFADGFVAPHLLPGSPDQDLAPERVEIVRNPAGEW